MGTTTTETTNPKTTKRAMLTWAEDESIQWYAAIGAELVQRSPMGTQLEALADQMGPTARTQALPGWTDLAERYDHDKPLSRARRMRARLIAADRVTARSSLVLLTYCHPIAVACESIPELDNAGGFESGPTRRHKLLPGGRLAALYTLTRAARTARRVEVVSRSFCAWPARPLVHVAGLNPSDAIRRLVDDKRAAKTPDEREAWRAIHREASDLLSRAVVAWRAARAILNGHNAAA